MPQGLHIGKVAEETGLSIHTIRFYQREGLLKEPLRSERGFRIFDEEGVRDLKFIRKAQELGFALSEIRELLVLQRASPQACSHVRDLLGKALGRVQEKIGDLTKLETELKAALRKCNRDLRRTAHLPETACPVLEELGRGNGEQGA
jgi:MerR family mercuric resistance operon transcriptional regulator